ncbi:MAG: FkbM family methyltransferase [Steroidobacteraceae bacterium]
MKYLLVILRDARGIVSVCGWLVAVRWLGCVVLTLPACLRTRNLQPGDRLMGQGPFLVTRGAAQARLSGEQIFSGIREIWVRDVYLKNNFLKIPADALVIDFGANLGNFTNLALAQHKDVRVIAVEPSLSLSNSLQASAKANGWADRVAVKRVFIGVTTQVQLSVADNPDYQGAPFITEKDFLDEFRVDRVDFLKCDIEGSEFFLLKPESKLLSLTRNLAIEIHSWGGSVPAFLDRLRDMGFEIGSVTYHPSGSCIALCRRAAVPSAARDSGDTGRPRSAKPRLSRTEATNGGALGPNSLASNRIHWPAIRHFVIFRPKAQRSA